MAPAAPRGGWGDPYLVATLGFPLPPVSRTLAMITA
jgi:hypothetical protein